MSFSEKLLRWIVIGGVFALPFVCLYVANTLFFPYITGKNFAFRIIVEVITAFWLALALVHEKYRPRRSWILGAFAIFVIVIAIADAQGANPLKSFWSNYERMDGWITLAHTLLYTVVAASVLNTEKLWRRLFQTSLGVSALLSVLGLLQLAGIFDLGSGGTGLAARIDVTFGNPIYFAVYMLFHIFIAALLLVQTRGERKKGRSLWPSILYGAVIVLDTIALLFTGTRGTMLGLIFGGLLALIMYSFSHGASKKIRTVTASALVIMVVCAGILFAARDTTFVRNVGFLQRLSTISLRDSTTIARFYNWGMAWQGVKERPIFGWGQENYAIVFDKHYDPRMYAQEQWFDRVHNVIFDWLVAGGFVGLFAYLLIFAALLWALWKTKMFTAAERAILTGLLFGYFVHNFFVFDNVTSYILFGTLIGYIVVRVHAHTPQKPLFTGPLLPKNTLPFAGIVAVVMACGIVYVVNVPALSENHVLIRAIMPQSDPIKNLAYFKSAIAYGTYGTQEAREQLIQIATQVAGAKGISLDVKQQFLNLSVNEMMLQEKKSPLDARFPLFIGIAEDAYGDYAGAKVALERAHALSPGKQTILFEIGLNALQRGDAAGYLAAFKEAHELDPNYVQARVYYMAALIRTGDDALADSLRTAIKDTPEGVDSQIAGAYADRKEYGKIVSIWGAYVAAHPTEQQPYLTLAAGYYAQGNKAQAIATLEALARAVPSSATDAQSFIQQIQNSTATI